MNNFLSKNRFFLAIIIGAIIIAGGFYLRTQDSAKMQSFATSDVAKTSKANINAESLKTVDKITGSAACGAATQTIVTKVIDGDTVVVEGGYHVRLLGMDADEKDYPCYDPAKNRLEALVLGKQVLLEKDKTDVDQYGRCLRYIFLGNTDVDVQLVKEGLAIARFYEPDVKYKTEISEAENQAQTSGTGCKWAGTPQTAKQ